MFHFHGRNTSILVLVRLVCHPSLSTGSPATSITHQDQFPSCVDLSWILRNSEHCYNCAFLWIIRKLPQCLSNSALRRGYENARPLIWWYITYTRTHIQNIKKADSPKVSVFFRVTDKSVRMFVPSIYSSPQSWRRFVGERAIATFKVNRRRWTNLVRTYCSMEWL